MKILHPNNIIVGDSCRSIDCKDSGYSGDNCSWVEPIVPPSRQLPTTGGGRPPLRPSQVRKAAKERGKDKNNVKNIAKGTTDPGVDCFDK